MDRVRLVSLLLPPGVSLLVHLGLLALVAAVSITAIQLRRPNVPTGDVIVTLENPAAAPAPADSPPPAETTQAAAALAPTVLAGPTRRADAVELVPPPIVLTPTIAPSPPGGAALSLEVRRAASSSAAFAGIRASRVRRVVYVVDISGPMASSLSFVLDELRRSVSRLDAAQHFQVILFRQDVDAGSEPESLWLGPADSAPRLLPASAANRAALAEFLADVRPSGRSNPLAGLRAALSLQPDAIFLLARGISRTGPNARWGEGTDAILGELDALNPMMNGRRRTAIKTIQFIDDDPTGLMQAIADVHGGGPDSYIRRNVEDLQAAGDPTAIESLIDAPNPSLDRAAALLWDLSTSRSDLRAIFGLASEADIAAVRRTTARALELVGAAESDPDADELARLVVARALLLRAATESGDRGPLLNRAVAASDTTEGAPAGVLATAALARAMRQSAGDPDAAAALARGAIDADQLSIAALESRLAAVLALASDPEMVEPWLGELDTAMQRPPLVVSGRLDAPLALLVLDAAAAARLPHATTPELINAAFARHLEWSQTPRPGLPGEAVLLAAGALIPADAPLDRIDPQLALARGLAMLPAPGLEPTASALSALDLASLRAAPDSSTAESAQIRAAMAVSLWAARTPLDDTGLAARADATFRLDRALQTSGDRAWRRDAAVHMLAHTGAILGAHAEDGSADAAPDPSVVARRRRALEVVVLDDPRPGPDTDAQRLELAQLTALADVGDGVLLDRALEVLQGPWAESPRSEIDRLSAWIHSTRVARLAADLGTARRTGSEAEAHEIAGSLVAAARLAIPPTARVAPEAADALRADMAEALILLGSPEASEIYADLRARGVSLGRSASFLTLAHARALLAQGDETGAFALLRDLTAASPRPPEHASDGSDREEAAVFWHAWTLTIELLTERIARTEDPQAHRTATAHLLRLHDLDPNLGGEPWESRLRASALSLGLSLDSARDAVPDGAAIHSPP